MNILLWFIVLITTQNAPPLSGVQYYRNIEYKTYDGRMFNQTDCAVEKNMLAFQKDSTVIWFSSYAYIHMGTFKYKETRIEKGYTVYCYVAADGSLLLIEKSLEMAYIFTDLKKQNYQHLIQLK